MYRLRTKLSISFLIVSLIVVLMISALANFFIKKQFTQYAIENKNRKIESILSLLADRYLDWGRQWDINGLESIGINALNDGLFLRIRDNQNSLLFDAWVHDNQLCSQMMDQFALAMRSRMGRDMGGYLEQTYPLLLSGQAIGSVDIGYYGPYFYTENDLRFLETLNLLLAAAGFISLFIAVGFGWLFTRQLTRPIVRVINATEKIADGQYNERLIYDSSTKELHDLTNSVNSLALKLENQNRLRKQLTSDVAHELRTPVTILRNHLEALLDGTWEMSAERLDTCHSEIMRITNLINDLEKLTTLDQICYRLEKSRFDLSQLLQ
ncbi:HAMP domain-containing protein, partial [Candidatus Dojkabacteria bacterium]|nr:HAMP domain-containing protein [Candidatus Dojkabacteria bacterium]